MVAFSLPRRPCAFNVVGEGLNLCQMLIQQPPLIIIIIIITTNTPTSPFSPQWRGERKKERVGAPLQETSFHPFYPSSPLPYIQMQMGCEGMHHGADHLPSMLSLSLSVSLTYTDTTYPQDKPVKMLVWLTLCPFEGFPGVKTCKPIYIPRIPILQVHILYSEESLPAMSESSLSLLLPAHSLTFTHTYTHCRWGLTGALWVIMVHEEEVRATKNGGQRSIIALPLLYYSLLSSLLNLSPLPPYIFPFSQFIFHFRAVKKCLRQSLTLT